MPNYQNGKIYKIVCDDTGETYFGSTVQTLSQRKTCHKNLRCCSAEIIKRGNYCMVLVENFPCDSKEELFSRERFYIENYPCVNHYRPIISKEEIKERMKEWYEKNKDKIAERNKERAEERSAVFKAWREANRDKVLERKREKIQCECGAWICRSGIARHKKRH